MRILKTTISHLNRFKDHPGHFNTRNIYTFLAAGYVGGTPAGYLWDDTKEGDWWTCEMGDADGGCSVGYEV